MTALAPHLSAYLRQYLPRDRRASVHTVDSYALTFELLLSFAKTAIPKRACLLKVEHLTPQLILDFLDSLETQRGNSVRTRNARLAAIKAFFRYLECRVPACLDLCQQVHALPTKRFDRAVVDYLDEEDMQAILDAPDPSTESGVRDRAMLHLAYATGVRVSELVRLKCQDLGEDCEIIHILGKGRLERTLPLWKETEIALKEWLAVRPNANFDNLFLNARGKPMTRHGFAHRLGLHAATAQQQRRSIARKKVSPHVLRHSCAMNTLLSTRDPRDVSIWLGHASMKSTEMYLHANAAQRLDILQAKTPPQLRRGSFRKTVTDRVMAMLQDVRRH